MSTFFLVSGIATWGIIAVLGLITVITMAQVEVQSIRHKHEMKRWVKELKAKAAKQDPESER